MRRKPDLARMVLLPALSPTEALILSELLDGALEALGNRATEAEGALVRGLSGDIGRQLRLIKWPVPEARRAPYPI